MNMFYPLSSAKPSISFTLVPWLKPIFYHNKELSEEAKQQGVVIWYARWLFVQISYSRWA